MYVYLALIIGVTYGIHHKKWDFPARLKLDLDCQVDNYIYSNITF